MKMEQSVPKRRHIKFRRRGITQKKTYNRKWVVPCGPTDTTKLTVAFRSTANAPNQ